MVHVRLLGMPAFARQEDGRPRGGWVPLPPLAAACLAYLLLDRSGGPVPRDGVAALLWRNGSRSQLRTRLRQTLRTLRRCLGQDVLAPVPRDSLMVDATAFECDLIRFERAMAAGRWAEAVALPTHPLLGDAYVSGAPELEQWLDGQRRRILSLICDAHWRLARELMDGGQSRRAVDYARAAVGLSPYDERGVRELVRMLFAVGDTAGALREFRGFERMMHREFRASPSSESLALVARHLRSRSVAPVPEPTPAP